MDGHGLFLEEDAVDRWHKAVADLWVREWMSNPDGAHCATGLLAGYFRDAGVRMQADDNLEEW